MGAKRHPLDRQPLNSGVPVLGAISTWSDVDYFKIVANPRSQLDLRLDQLTADCDLYLYNSSGALVAVSNNGGTTPDEITGRLSNSIYFAKVIGYAQARCSYRLSLTLK